MADNVVVARYELDTSQFDAGVDEVVKGYAEIDKAAKGAASTGDEVASGLDDVGKAAQNATKGTTALTVSTGSLGAKFAELVEQEARAAAQADELGKAQSKNISIFARVGQGIKQFAAGARDGFKTAIKEVGGFSGITSQLGAKFKGFGATASNALKSVSSGITSSVSQIPLIGGIATALGPVGLAAAAVAGGLFKVITNTDAGATALEGLGRTGGLVFDRVTGAVTGFFNELTDGTGIIGQTFDFLAGAVDVFINKLTPIGAIFDAISETSIFQGLKQDFEDGQRIAQLYDDLDEKQRNSITTVADLDAEYRQLNVQLRDRTKTEAERLAIADQLTAAETERARIELGLLQASTKAIEEEVALARQRNEVSDDLDRRLQEARAAETAASAASVERLEKAENRKNAILDKGDQDRAAAQAKAQQAQQKREAEAQRKAEQRAQAEAKLNETIATLSQEAYERTLTDSEKEVEAIKQKYSDLETVTLEGIQKLREASPANAQSEITAKEAEAIIAIERAKNEELLALQVEQDAALAVTREEALDGIRQSLLTDTELQREAVLQQLDEQVAAAEKFITNEEERNAVIAELTKKAEAELTGIITDEEAKRREAAQIAFEEQTRRAEEGAAIVASFAEQSLQTIITAAATGQDIQEAAAKQLLVLLLDTLEKIIIANAFQAQAISAGSPDPANVASGGTLGIIRGVILAGIVKALFGAAKAAITANFEGDPYVGGDGSRPTWSGRDGFLRRLDKGERVVTRRTNEEHFPALEAMESGRFDDWVLSNYLPRMEELGVNDDDRIVKYVNSDMGERLAHSITLPKMFDKGIVESTMSVRRELGEQTHILAALLHQSRPRRRNTRYN